MYLVLQGNMSLFEQTILTISRSIKDYKLSPLAQEQVSNPLAVFVFVIHTTLVLFSTISVVPASVMVVWSVRSEVLNP